MVRLIRATLAGVLLVIPAAAARGQERPIPQDPARQAQRFRDKLAWHQRTFAGSYEKVGKKDARWDKPARETLEAAVHLFSRDTDPCLGGEDVNVPARRAVAAGCDDALILYLYARASAAIHANDPDEYERRASAAIAAMERSSYPPILRVLAPIRLAVHRAYTPGMDPAARKAVTQMLDKAVALLPESAAKDERSPDVEYLWFDIARTAVDAFHGLNGGYQEAFDRVDAVLARSPALASLRLQLKGQFLVQFAWEARGSGPASTVKPDDWRRFEARLAGARKAFEDAWALRPGDWVAATEMLTVETGLGGERDSMEKWFRRAMETDGDNRQACAAKLNWLDPKWHGSREELLAFGKACRDTKNWRSGITLLAADAHFRIGRKLPPDEQAAYFESPAVWDDIKSVYDEYLRHYTNDPAERTMYAALCYLCGKYTEADQQFRNLGKDLVPTTNLPQGLLEHFRTSAASLAHPQGARSDPPPANLPSPRGFRPLALEWKAAFGETLVLRTIDGCLATDGGFDVIWSGNEVFLLKDRKRLVNVHTAGGRYVRIGTPCFDGRIVWMPIRSEDKPPYLIMIVPETERVWTYMLADKLPVKAQADLPPDTVQSLSVAPVGPGNACVAGSHTGSWIAMATFAPNTGKSIRIFHEAREPREDRDREQWKRTTVSFVPQYMGTLTAPGRSGAKPTSRIVLGRSGTSGLNAHPLVIDPESRSVTALPGTIDVLSRGSIVPGSVAFEQGRLYWVATGASRQGTVMQLGLPDLTGKSLVRGLRSADKVAVLGGRVHVLGDQWWTAELSGGEARPLPVELPWVPADEARARLAARAKGYARLVGVCRSNHLGLIVLTRFEGRQPVAYQVDLPELVARPGRATK